MVTEQQLSVCCYACRHFNMADSKVDSICDIYIVLKMEWNIPEINVGVVQD
jgi:hypothetical protein